MGCIGSCCWYRRKCFHHIGRRCSLWSCNVAESKFLEKEMMLQCFCSGKQSFKDVNLEKNVYALSIKLIHKINGLFSLLDFISVQTELGRYPENQNGNLRWHLPLGVRPPPPPLNGKISRHFFTPLFFFCN